MAWNTVCPDGTKTVKANNPIIQDNIDYIKTTMVKDHYWDESANLDGRHRQVSYQASTADNALGSDVAGNHYIRKVSATATRQELFFRNSSTIYQVTPSLLTGTKSVSSSYVNLVAVPENVYGEIFMYTTVLGKLSVCTGFFRSNGTAVEAWAVTALIQGNGSGVSALRFGNGSEASALNIQVQTKDASTGLTWNYIVTYRGL